MSTTGDTLLTAEQGLPSPSKSPNHEKSLTLVLAAEFSFQNSEVTLACAEFTLPLSFMASADLNGIEPTAASVVSPSANDEEQDSPNAQSPAVTAQNAMMAGKSRAEYANELQVCFGEATAAAAKKMLTLTDKQLFDEGNLINLNVAFSNIGRSGAVMVGRVMLGSVNLRHVDVSFNGIGDAGLETVLKAAGRYL